MKKLEVAIASLGLVLGSCFTAALAAERMAGAADHILLRPGDLKWVDAPAVGPKAQIAIIEGDLKAAAPYTFRIRVPANFKVSVHTHPVIERVTVVSGSFYFGTGDKFDPAKAKRYRTGAALIIPAGTPMYAFTRKEGAVVQIHGTGPWGINYLNPGDDPKNKKK